jgi:hypothetical protein
MRQAISHVETMLSVHLLVEFASVTVAGALIFVLFRHLLSPLRSVPGPLLARFSDVWYLYHVRKGHLEQENLALHARYGK